MASGVSAWVGRGGLSQAVSIRFVELDRESGDRAALSRPSKCRDRPLLSGRVDDRLGSRPENRHVARNGERSGSGSGGDDCERNPVFREILRAVFGDQLLEK